MNYKKLARNAAGAMLGLSLFAYSSDHLTDNKYPIEEQAQVQENPFIGFFNHASPLEFEVTAYIETGNNTATGVYPRFSRTVAIDPMLIPLGSELYIPKLDGKTSQFKNLLNDSKNYTELAL